MPAGPHIKKPSLCECGDLMRWQRTGVIRPKWRLECICGRCGPWRSQPTLTSKPILTSDLIREREAERCA